MSKCYNCGDHVLSNESDSDITVCDECSEFVFYDDCEDMDCDTCGSPGFLSL